MNVVDFRAARIAASDRDRAGAEMVAHLIRQMKRPVNGKVTLDEWADYARVGKFELIAAFKALTGIPPIAFHNAEKLEIAKRLLVFERMSVTDACFEIGFESVGSFVSKFSRSVGIPPGSYSSVMTMSGFARTFVAVLLGGRAGARQERAKRRVVFERPAGSGLHGLIAARFGQAYPCGMPNAWRFVSPASDTALFDAGPGSYCLVASMPSLPRLAELVNFRPALIGRERMPGDGSDILVRLRPPTVFDPPITLAVPALFCRNVISA